MFRLSSSTVARPLRTDVPFDPARAPLFYGWVVLVVATLGIVMVVSSALRPTYLAASRAWLGSYAPGLYAAVVLPASVLLLSLATTNPRQRLAGAER